MVWSLALVRAARVVECTWLVFTYGAAVGVHVGKNRSCCCGGGGRHRTNRHSNEVTTLTSHSFAASIRDL